MNLELVVPGVIAAMLILAIAGTWSTPLRAAVIVPVALAASAALGTPHLSGTSGLLAEPVRVWGAHALIVAMAAAALLRISGSKRWGLVAAGSTLALLGGHAAIVLGGLLVADAAFAICSCSERPVTLHAAISSRTTALTVLVSDALLAAAVLLGTDAAVEPLAVSGGVLMTVALGVRCVALLGIGRAQPAPAPLLLGVPMIAPLGWLSAADARAVVLVAAATAAVAALRWARVSHPASASTALVLLAIAAGATAAPEPLVLVPLLFVVAVSAAIVPELFAGGSLLVVAAVGGASLGSGGAVLGALAETDRPWLRLGAVAAVAAIAALTVGAFGQVRTRVERERDLLLRLPLGIVFGGLLLLVAIVPGQVVAAIDDAVLASRIPDQLVRTSTVFEAWLPGATAGALAVFLMLTRTPLRQSFRDPVSPVEPSREIVSAIDGDASPRWLQSVGVLLGVAGALVLGVLARSASQGWL